jgi:osmotically inducible protein OsmC
MKMYSTEVTATGGRTGRAKSSDGRLGVTLSIPKEIGGDGGPGTNPEQLFAAGYAACFDSALRLVARRQKVTVPEGSTISADVGLVRTPAGTFELEVVLTGRLPGLAPDAAQALMDAAHTVCPYSNATRGNINVTLTTAPADAALASASSAAV